MFNDRSRGAKLDTVLDALRRRICLAPADEEFRLHETALAAEFEMSRTPIRQVLQRLSYERLVETRSGVGTLATPMRAVDRPRDQRTHRGLVGAILQHDLAPLPLIERTQIAALGAMMGETRPIDRETAFEARGGLLAVLCPCIPDPILRDAFQASHWRDIRWLMLDFAENPERAGAVLRAQISAVGGAAADGAGAVFEAIQATSDAAL